MGTYNSAVITNGGQSMIAQAVAGASLEFTTIKTSNYAYPAGTNLATLTTINGIKQSKDITSATVYNSRVIKISAAVDNTGISTAYTINAIGIYAKVGSSAESLFAVVTASAADTMPAYSDKPYSYIYEINLTMQNAANMTVTVNAAGLVNVADLNAAKFEIQGEIADLRSATVEIQGEIADLKSAIDALKITDTASGAIASFPDGAAMPMEGLTVEMEPIQEGTGDPSPDNIRPISGRTEVTVTRAGKNLFDVSQMHLNKSYDGTDRTGRSVGTFKLPAGDYTIKLNDTSIFSEVTVAKCKKPYPFASPTDGGLSGTLNIQTSSSHAVTYTIDGTYQYIYVLAIKSTTATEADFANAKFQLEIGSTATDYEPFDGASVTVQLGQTVYGGTVDVTTGVLTVDRAMVTYDGSENWYTNNTSDGVKYRMALDSLPSGIKTVTNITEIPEVVTNILPAISADESWRGIDGVAMQKTYGWRIYCEAFNTSDAAPWKAFLAEHPLTIAYKLAQPINIALTPEHLTTVLGQNNVWSDGGDVSVDYVADTKLYIAQLTEPDADMVADANITSGSYFMVGNNLYLATANIASGANIVPGVNCNRTNLASALNAINA